MNMLQCSATSRIIEEQSLEWNSPINVTFADYGKAFDSVYMEGVVDATTSLWYPIEIHDTHTKDL